MCQVLSEISWERMIRAVEKVRERLQRATAALSNAGLPYAVAGGNAVAVWVSRVDEAAVRYSPDMEILLRRSDLEAATVALSKAGFVRRHVSGIEMFLDGPGSKARDAVHVVLLIAFAEEMSNDKIRMTNQIQRPKWLMKTGVILSFRLCH